MLNAVGVVLKVRNIEVDKHQYNDFDKITFDTDMNISILNKTIVYLLF